jgi:rubredoxin
VCKAATTQDVYKGEVIGDIIDYSAICDEYSDMMQIVCDFENGEGAFEDKPDALMCNECDGPMMPDERVCPACGRVYTDEEVA